MDVPGLVTWQSLPMMIIMSVIFRIGNELNSQMSFQTREQDFTPNYDFIIVGGTSSGVVIASHLARKHRVLLLETGSGHSPNSWMQSSMASSTYNQPYNVYYETQGQSFNCKYAVGDRCIFGRSRVFGGRDVVSSQLYLRGFRKDYDDWDVEGWKYEDIEHYFNRAEVVRRQYILGRVGITRESSSAKVRSFPAFFEQAGRDKGYVTGRFDEECGTGQDTCYSITWSDMVESHYFQHPRRYPIAFLVKENKKNSMACDSRFKAVSRKDLNSGTFDPAEAYLRPHLSHLRLHIDIYSRINKILINHKRQAYGVEVYKDNVKKTYFASKEVILTAGPLETPKILKLSGVGPEDELNVHKIPVASDLPVGENMITSVGVFGNVFIFGQPIEDVLQVVGTLQSPQAILDSFRDTGVSPSGTFEGVGLINTNSSEDCRADILAPLVTAEFAFNPGSIYSMGTPLMIKPEVIGAYGEIFGRQSVAIPPSLIYPKSRGAVLLRSTEAKDPPVIIHNMLKEKEDVDVLVKGMKFVISLPKTRAGRKVQAKYVYVNLPGCKHYTLWSDAYIECFVRTLGVAGKEVGTARMGNKDDEQTVVDEKLRVINVKGLRVADESIIPKITRALEQADRLMIGEKAADLIMGDWEKHQDKGPYYDWPCTESCTHEYTHEEGEDEGDEHMDMEGGSEHMEHMQMEGGGENMEER